MYTVNSNLSRMIDNFFNEIPVYNTRNYLSENEKFEINHTKDGAYLLFEAPGFNKSNLKVEMEDGHLLIEGERSYKLNDKETTKKISKKFKVGEDYNADNIEATIEDGLLTVYVPNYKKQDKKKRISLL